MKWRMCDYSHNIFVCENCVLIHGNRWAEDGIERCRPRFGFSWQTEEMHLFCVVGSRQSEMHVWWQRVCQIHVHPKVNDFNRSNSCIFFHTLSCSFPLNAYCLTQSFEPLSIVVILKWNSSKLKMRATTEPFLSNELKNSTLFKLNRKISLFIFHSVVAREKGRLHAQPPHFECEWCECVAIRKNKQFST